LAHVLQQRRGRVKAPPGADLAVVQDRMLEMEADRMGQRAASLAAQMCNRPPKIQRVRTTPPFPSRRSLQMMEQENPFTDILSDVGESSEDEIKNSIFDLDSMRRGTKKQETRGTILGEFGHINSARALRYVIETAMGPSAASQGTVLTYYGNDGSTTIYSTTSCAPLRQYVSEYYSLYGYVDSYRSTFGDGSHVHAEAFAIFDRVRNQRKQPHDNDAVVVAKPVCDVCKKVLAALGIKIADQASGQLSTDKWCNPWSIFAPNTLDEVHTAEIIDDVLTKFDKKYGGQKQVWYWNDPRAPLSEEDFL
jgi:hypothetical protein